METGKHWQQIQMHTDVHLSVYESRHNHTGVSLMKCSWNSCANTKWKRVVVGPQ